MRSITMDDDSNGSLPTGRPEEAHARPHLPVPQHVAQIYNGPLPQADEFRAYNAVLPGAADRILQMAERQAAHRQAAELIALKADARRSDMGLVLSYLTYGGTMAAAVVLILTGKSVEGLVSLAVAIGTAYGPKIFMRRWQHEDH